jgi:hypothetical protein
MNHEKNSKASFLLAGVAKTQGRAHADQLSPPKSRDRFCPPSVALPNAIASRLSESGHFLAISRENRGGTYARSVPYAGASPLEDIVSRTASRSPYAQDGTELCTPPPRSEFGTWPAQSSGFLGGICALSAPCEGELALWRIAPLQLPYGHPELDVSVFQSSSLEEPQNK